MFRPPACLSTLRAGVFVLVSLVSANQASAGPAKTPAETPEAVVAIGDVHGDFDDFVALLQHIGLIDAQNHWTGNKTTFVQVGDLLDRGPKPRQVLDFMMALEKEAPKSGGRVVPLLGNHEMMNIMGDLRYVTPENYASFADSKSEERQKSAYQQYIKWRDSHKALLAELPQPMELTEAEWMARHPQGFVEQREAFAPDGSYGKWLREHAPLAKIGSVIFLHGGIHPNLAHLKLDTINAHVHDEIKAFDSAKQDLLDQKVILPFFTLQEITAVVQAEVVAERKSRVSSDEQRQARIVQFLGYGEWLSVRPDGPLWFRGYDQWTDEEGAAQLGKVLEAYDAAHIAVGHTVQKGGRIRMRFDGKVFLIDTGMLSSYYPGGRASALEICGDTKFMAAYMDQQVVLLDTTASSPAKAGSAAPAPVADAAKASDNPAVLPGAGGICPAMAAAAH
jgi:calcineurin-like phosphoesterase family protein